MCAVAHCLCRMYGAKNRDEVLSKAIEKSVFPRNDRTTKKNSTENKQKEPDPLVDTNYMGCKNCERMITSYQMNENI